MSTRMMGLAVCLLFVLGSTACAQDKRIGFAEEFDSVDGWKVTSGGTLESMKSEDGVAVFDTYIGGFQTVRLPNQPVVGGRVYVSKTYEQEVDLDKYHYIVMDVTEKNMLTILYVQAGRRRYQTHVAASTGMSAQDITPLGLTGKQKITFAFKIVNRGSVCKVDYIRFVSRLTDEEKKVLVAPPLKLYREGLERHPYQKLEALWRRAPRPWTDVPKSAEEKALLRDVGTGMPTWRLTATPAHEGINGTFKPRVWRPDGSSISTPRRTYHFVEDKWVLKGGKHYTPRDYVAPKEKVEPVYAVVDDKANKKVIFKRLKPKPGEKEIIYEHPYPTKPYYYGARIWVRGNRLIAAFRGAEAVLVCPEEKDPKKRVRVTPMLYFKDDKGCHISEDGRYISLSTPFGSYHSYKVDLVEQTHFPGAGFTQSHGCGGSPWRIMTYGETGKVAIHDDAYAPRNYTPGKDIKVLGVWLGSISTDYGEMTKDSRYGITNGMKGELGSQYVLFDRLDAGTILRLCTYNVSYETWDLRAKVSASLDYTKLAYASDMLGTADYYITTIRRPDAPVNVKAERAAGGVKIAWEAPTNHREIRGYHVYRSTRSGIGYARLSRRIVPDTTFTHTRAPAGEAAFYVVTAEEHSGLMSVFSPEVSAEATRGRLILHYEAEAQEKTRPMRDVVDGAASGYRAARLTKLAADEDVGTFNIATKLPRRGNYWVWGRCRGWRDENKGTFKLKLGPKRVGTLRVDSGKWTWVRTGTTVALTPDARLIVSSADDSILIDKTIITDDAAYKPRTADDRKAPPAPVKGLHVTQTTPNSVELAWEPSPDPDVYCYSVYVGEEADFTPGNETLLCSPRRAAAADWGIRPDTMYHYKVVVLDKLGNASAPAAIEAKTKALDVVTKALPATAAKATPGLKRGTMSGAEYIEYPGKDAGAQSLTFDFDLPADGTYYVWMKYTPTFNQRWAWDSMGVSWDGGKLTPYRPRPRAPRGQRGGNKRWFVEHLTSQNQLKAGKHSVKLIFREGGELHTRMGQRVAGLWVSNDASFVPPGYICQVMFSKPARWTE